MQCGRPKPVIAALLILRQTPFLHTFLILCRLHGSHHRYNGPETLHLFWKECRTNLKRPGGRLPANSHLGNKNRALMGTVSRDAVEPQAGNAGFTDSKHSRRKDEWFTAFLLFIHFFCVWGSAGETQLRKWRHRCCSMAKEINWPSVLQLNLNRTIRKWTVAIMHLLAASLSKHTLISIYLTSRINNRPHSHEFYIRSLLILSLFAATQKRRLRNTFFSLIKLHDWFCASTNEKRKTIK